MRIGMKSNCRKKFLGVNIDVLSMNQTLERISEIIETRKITQHVVVNVSKLVFAQKDRNLKKIINSCGLINVDGAGVIWGAALLGLNIPERVTGIDLMQRLVEESAKKGYRIYFLGAEEQILRKVVEVYSKKYPSLKIAGYRNGYFPKEMEEDIALDIKDSHADILFVAMGSPKKEIFLNEYIQLMQVPFVMGVGGSFDVVAGKTKRAPLWMQNNGLEWFFRFIQEPKRMFWRYFYTNLDFLLMIIKRKLKGYSII